MIGRYASAERNTSVWLWLSTVMLVCGCSLGFQIKEKACGGEGMPVRSYLPEMFRLALLPDLVVNTPSSGSIYSSSFASGTDKIYGEALCNATTLGACETCHGCLSFLKDHVLQYCSASTQVLIWAHECFLHFDIGPFDKIPPN